MSGKDSKTILDSIEETRQYHARYLRAINNPLRRKILQALRDEYTTIEDLQFRTGIDINSLNWHLTIKQLEPVAGDDSTASQSDDVLGMTERYGDVSVSFDSCLSFVTRQTMFSLSDVPPSKFGTPVIFCVFA